MNKVSRRPTLDQAATYQVVVPGELDESWTEWDGTLTVRVVSEGGGSPVTTLTGVLDQAALHGLLRRLYALGLPLISVRCVDCGPEDG